MRRGFGPGTSTAEVVEADVFRFHTEIIEHLEYGGIHHRRAAEVVLDVFGSRVILQVVIQHDLMNEAGVARPVVFRQRV